MARSDFNEKVIALKAANEKIEASTRESKTLGPSTSGKIYLLGLEIPKREGERKNLSNSLASNISIKRAIFSQLKHTGEEMSVIFET